MCRNLSHYLIAIILLTGCATVKDSNVEVQPQKLTKTERIDKLSNLLKWQIKGRLAFIQTDKRESATLFWKYDQNQSSQELNLTTYLGINILSLESNQGSHTVEVDGEVYQGNDLEHLVYSLTQLTMPVGAMAHWLKGLAFLPNDKVEYNDNTLLPETLSSYYNGQSWKINYSNYQRFGLYTLPKRITINSHDLTIKVQINQWTTS